MAFRGEGLCSRDFGFASGVLLLGLRYGFFGFGFGKAGYGALKVGISGTYVS